MLHRDTQGVIAFCKWAASRPSVIALYCTFTVCPRRAEKFLCIAYSNEVAGADKVGLEDHQGLEESAARKVIIDTNLHITSWMKVDTLLPQSRYFLPKAQDAALSTVTACGKGHKDNRRYLRSKMWWLNTSIPQDKAAWRSHTNIYKFNLCILWCGYGKQASTSKSLNEHLVTVHMPTQPIRASKLRHHICYRQTPWNQSCKSL